MGVEQILSQGSDPKAIQPFYEKLFDSVDRVTHDRKVPNMITQLRNIVGKDFEEVALVQHVMAGGNIEEWLETLETMMKRTVKVCRLFAHVGQTFGC